MKYLIVILVLVGCIREAKRPENAPFLLRFPYRMVSDGTRKWLEPKPQCKQCKKEKKESEISFSGKPTVCTVRDFAGKLWTKCVVELSCSNGHTWSEEF